MDGKGKGQGKEKEKEREKEKGTGRHAGEGTSPDTDTTCSSLPPPDTRIVPDPYPPHPSKPALFNISDNWIAQVNRLFDNDLDHPTAPPTQTQPVAMHPSTQLDSIETLFHLRMVNPTDGALQAFHQTLSIQSLKSPEVGRRQEEKEKKKKKKKKHYFLL